MDRSDYRFSRRQLREHFALGDTQLRLHLNRLIEMEYVIVHRGSRGKSYVYELAYEGSQADGRHLVGLLDPKALSYTEGGPRTMKTSRGKSGTSRGQTANVAPPSRPQNGGVAGTSRGSETNDSITPKNTNGESPKSNAKNAHLDQENFGASYADNVVAAAER